MANRIISHESAILNLWLNWIVAVGALVIPVIMRVYLPELTIPAITFGVMGALILYDRFSLRGRWAVCPLLPSIAIWTLGISGILMIIISIIYSKGLINYISDAGLVNDHIPYLTILIVAPVLVGVILWSKFLGRRYSACQNCFITLGSESERGFLGKLFSQESKYQRNFLLAIAITEMILSWGYYIFFYINVNLNQPDKFFFGWIPVILYAISVFYLGARYFTIWAYYFQDVEGSEKRHGASTAVRYLIVSGDNLYLSRSEEFGDIPDSSLIDTPASLVIDHRHQISAKEAESLFRDMSRLHTEKLDFRGKWYNLAQVERLLHNHDLSHMLASEIHRIYTVSMAWKTYDYEGRRLYKVKNYRPLFRLNGICDWEVDFNSTHWMNVARFNEDKPFFRLRRLFRSRPASPDA